MSYPVLYTFRRCPYAMRARMAFAVAGVNFEVREVVLRDKPEAMLDLSPKATVPVLQLQDRVLDESLDIMHWALGQNDPEGWMAYSEATEGEAVALVKRCDEEFKVWLDRYKYNNHQSHYSELEARHRAEEFLEDLELRLAVEATNGGHLFGQLSFADVAIFPFVRQFAFVDKPWFDASPYARLKEWLAGLLGSEHFLVVMQKYPQWNEGQDPMLFR